MDDDGDTGGRATSLGECAAHRAAGSRNGEGSWGDAGVADESKASGGDAHIADESKASGSDTSVANEPEA